MEKRTMIALFVSIVILFAFQMIFMKPKPTEKKNEPVKQEMTTAQEEKKQETTLPKPVKKSTTANSETALQDFVEFASEQRQPSNEFGSFESNHYRFRVQPVGGTLHDFYIKQYNFSLIADGSFTLVYENGGQTITDALIPYTLSTLENGIECTYTAKNWYIKKTFTLHEGKETPYFVTVTVDSNIPFEKLSVTKRMLTDSTELMNGMPIEYSGKYRQIKIKKDKPAMVTVDTWTGFESKYFLFTAFQPDANVSAYYSLIPKKNEKDADTVTAIFTLNNKALTFFYAPKELKLLKHVGYQLDRSVNLSYAILRPISLLMLQGMQELFKVVKNYGIAIIILTLIIRLIFWPLTHKSSVSMAKMQKLQPEIQKLQKQYKDKPEELNRRLMEIYSKNKVNPMGGCLPVLIQLPVLFALYSVFNSAIELRGAHFFLWIKDLSRPDTLFSLGFDLPFLGSNVNILPILMLLSMLWQMKINSAQSSSLQGVNKFLMQYFMPVFMLILFYKLPSGLTLYFLFSNIFGIFQQMYTNKHLKKGA